MTYRLCFVCLGNICRSPMAEIVMRSLLDGSDLDVDVSSAGTGDWHVGEQADPRALATLHAHGYDGASHRARQFEPEWFADLDLVVALDHANLAALRRMAPVEARERIRLLRSFDPDAEGDLDVPDPYMVGGFDHALDLVERGCRGLLADLRERRAR